MKIKSIVVVLISFWLTSVYADDKDYRWNGFYAGMHGGYSWSAFQNATHGSESFSNFDGTYYTPGTQLTSQYWTHGAPAFNGGLYGVELGYSFLHQDKWVLGIAGRFNPQNQSGSTARLGALGQSLGDLNYIQQTLAIDIGGNLLGKMGYLIKPDHLLYLLAGLAINNVKTHFDYTNDGGITSHYESHPSTSQSLWGWSVGFGSEYKLTKNLSLKADALYTDLGRASALTGTPVYYPATGPSGFHNAQLMHPDIGASVFASGIDVNFVSVSAGINYAF